MPDDAWLRNRMRWQYRPRALGHSVALTPVSSSTVYRCADSVANGNGEQGERTEMVDPGAVGSRPVISGAQLQQVFRQREAAALFGVSVSTWKRYVAAGIVPQPVRLGPRRVGWLERDLIAAQNALRGAHA